MSLPGKTCSFFHCNRQEISFGEMITSSADFSGSCKRWGLVAYKNPICSMYRLYTRCLLGGYWGGAFKHFLFSSLLGEDFQLHSYFADGLKAPNNFGYIIPTTYYQNQHNTLTSPSSPTFSRFTAGKSWLAIPTCCITVWRLRVEDSRLFGECVHFHIIHLWKQAFSQDSTYWKRERNR